jgi:hypothetical protein
MALSYNFHENDNLTFGLYYFILSADCLAIASQHYVLEQTQTHEAYRI